MGVSQGGAGGQAGGGYVGGGDLSPGTLHSIETAASPPAPCPRQAPAKPRSAPTRGGACWGTTCLAGALAACLVSRAAATLRPLASARRVLGSLTQRNPAAGWERRGVQPARRGHRPHPACDGRTPRLVCPSAPRPAAAALRLPLQEREPHIHAAIRFGAVLENVSFDEESREVDWDASLITENSEGGLGRARAGWSSD